VRELFAAGGVKALAEIPGVGPRIAGGLAELVRTGRWTYLERLRGVAEPRDIFCTIPGVGPILAKRLHETLHVEILEQLEAALHEKGATPVAGIGPRRLAILRATLGNMLARIRTVRTGPADEPSVDILLDVDREYRQKAGADQLYKIAPKRFNPGGEAWLPLLHTRRSNFILPRCFPIPRSPMNSARNGIGSFSISILIAAARRSGPSSRKHAGRSPDSALSADANANASVVTRARKNDSQHRRTLPVDPASIDRFGLLHLCFRRAERRLEPSQEASID
jgi:hypothetical protein